jgi:hypothetical protein
MANIGPSKVPGHKAGPNGSFPVGDPKHARLAIGGATRSFHAGNISSGQEAHIKADARAELNKSGNHYPGLGKGDKRASR